MLINKKNNEAVRDMLHDDESFKEVVTQEFVKSRQALQRVLSVLKFLCGAKTYHPNKSFATWSDLYIYAMSGSLLDSTPFQEIIDSIKRLPSTSMVDLLDQLAATPFLSLDLAADLADFKAKIEDLTEDSAEYVLPLRSTYDIQHSTIRTTVVAQKVSLSKSAAQTSSKDTAYTKIVDQISKSLYNYFQTTLINPSELFLNEILIYDSKSPHREVFDPRPRFAIERALSVPHDYLSCECCSSDEGTGLQASQPATAILYHLYLESSSVINTADLWEAFWTIVGGDGEDVEGERERVLALFSRALAELKYLGMIKTSRKKADLLQKLSWKGL